MTSGLNDGMFDEAIRHTGGLTRSRTFERRHDDSRIRLLRQNSVALPCHSSFHAKTTSTSGSDLIGPSSVSLPSIAAALACLHQSIAVSITSSDSSFSRIPSIAQSQTAYRDVLPAQPFFHNFSALVLPSVGENLREPRLELETVELWRQFYRLTTEMVITKSGR
jgi:hypothetical protein